MGEQSALTRSCFELYPKTKGLSAVLSRKPSGPLVLTHARPRKELRGREGAKRERLVSSRRRQRNPVRVAGHRNRESNPGCGGPGIRDCRTTERVGFGGLLSWTMATRGWVGVGDGTRRRSGGRLPARQAHRAPLMVVRPSELACGLREPSAGLLGPALPSARALGSGGNGGEIAT